MANRTAWPGEERLNRFLASDQRDLFGIDYWNAGRDASRRGHLVYLAGSKRKQSNDQDAADSACKQRFFSLVTR